MNEQDDNDSDVRDLNAQHVDEQSDGENVVNIRNSVRAVVQVEELMVAPATGPFRVFERYRYQPLTKPNEIRLLRVSRESECLRMSERRFIPRCELVHFTLDDVPEYFALSYAWGDLLEFQPILFPDDKYLMTGRVLEEALCRFSEWGEPRRYVWADQLCINQYDVTERNQQVGLMGDIYQRAWAALIWLGPGDQNTDVAFDFRHVLSYNDFPLDQMVEFFAADDSNPLLNLLAQKQVPLADLQAAMTSLERLVEKTWFTRLWTLQEVIVARAALVLCGDRICAFEEVVRLTMLVQSLTPRRYTSGMRQAMQLWLQRERYRNPELKSSLETLLMDMAELNYSCGDPRDNIYALLALQDPSRKRVVSVNYDLAVAQVFRDTAQCIIQSTGRLDLLTRQRIGSRTGLPSWAPDWAIKTSARLTDPNRKTFTASGALQVPTQIYFQDDQLITCGRTLGWIRKFTDHKFGNQIEGHFTVYVNEFLGGTTTLPVLITDLEAAQAQSSTATPQTRAHWNWLIANSLTCGLFPPGEEASFDSERAMTNLALDLGARGPRAASALKHCPRRTLALLDSPQYPLALVPDYARVGDRICLLDGAPTPLLLRTKGADVFENLGECYVHGAMFGEGWDGSESDVFHVA